MKHLALLLALATGCQSGPGSLDGSLSRIFDLSYTSVRARLYPSELSVEYVDEARYNAVALRVTLDHLDELQLHTTYDLYELGHIGVSDSFGGSLPPLLSGTITLRELSVDAPEPTCRGDFSALFQTAAGDRFSVFGPFDARLEVVDAI